MNNALSPASTTSMEPIPLWFLGDDATSADQIALAVIELLDKPVVTIDAESVIRGGHAFGEGFVRVINTAARALPRAEADTRNRLLARHAFSGQVHLPVIQIDSRLRGIGNAVRGFYECLDFDFLLFVPAEPELNRLTRNGVFCHVENGCLVPFHQSQLVNRADVAPKSSDLREWLAAELGASIEQIVSINEELVSQGADAIVDFVRGIRRQGKSILIPDVTTTEHFEAVVSASKKLAQTLIVGSRTFLRSFLGSYGECSARFARMLCDKAPLQSRTTERRSALVSFRSPNVGTQPMPSLFQAIDRQKRGAPLAVVSSLEPAMNSQVEYAQRALGPNLVTVDFDSAVVLADDQGVCREISRAQDLVLQSLKAMRPVLLQTARKQAFTEPAVQQKHLTAIGEVVADQRIHEYLTSLFISGGQTAETIKKALGISATEVKGPFQESIPWCVPLEGPLKNIPLVTKGGRMGAEDVLYAFLDQGHPLPRANVLPIVTPLTQEKKVDEAGIEKLIAHLVRLGATDVFAVGNAGEFRFLANDQRLKALEVFARQAEGKLRVFAGITGDTADETRKNYEAAGKLSVHAAVVMPLFFLNSSEEIVPFVESLAPIQPKLPLILYNNPERTKGQHISFEAVEALQFPVVAIKDSSGDLDRFDRYARSMAVYEGQQRQFIEGFQHGARGTIGIIGHVSALPNEFFAPTTTAARREEIARQINDLSKVVKQGGAEVAAYKFALSLMGVIGDTVASNEPARELTPEQRELIRTRNAELISSMRASQG